MTITANGLSPKESKTDCLTKPQYSGISEHSPIADVRSYIEGLQMSLRPVSLVSRSALPENEKANRTVEISGLKRQLSFAWYDRLTRSLKMSQGSLFQDICLRFSAIWPKQGTMLDGVCWALTMWVPTIGGKGCGYWPTPNRPDGGRTIPKDAEWRGMATAYNKKGKKIQVGLESAVRKWSTPHGFSKDGKSNGPSGNELGRAVNLAPQRSLPGPNFTRTNRENPGGAGLPAKSAKSHASQYPTPSSSMMTDADMEQARYAGSDKRRPNYKEAGIGSLNPPWVEWLMGWPIGWTDLKPLETDKFRKWLQLHGRS